MPAIRYILCRRSLHPWKPLPDTMIATDRKPSGHTPLDQPVRSSPESPERRSHDRTPLGWPRAHAALSQRIDYAYYAQLQLRSAVGVFNVVFLPSHRGCCTRAGSTALLNLT